MRTAIEDIRWVASEVDDLAVLLRVHGIGTLADKLDAVRKALRSELTAKKRHQAGLGSAEAEHRKSKIPDRRSSTSSL
jgi:hypothetical protein